MGGELLESVLENLRSYRDPHVVVIEAPPGYGKSTSVPLLAKELYERKLCSNFIHVLPLRAIVSDLYRNFYLKALTTSDDDVTRKARKALESMGLGAEDVAYQMCMDLLLREEVSGSCAASVRKSPAFDARAIVSTLDSFAYNLMRAPVIDSFRQVKRYAIVRARIFTSAVFFDEAHMILRYPDEENAGRILAFVKKMIEYTLSSRTPLVVMSATLGEWFRQKLASWSNQRVRMFTLGCEEGARNHRVAVEDRDFLERALMIEWRTELIRSESVASKAEELVDSGKKVLIVRDYIRDAVTNYRQLREKGIDAVLLHGQLTVGDRARATLKVEEHMESGGGFAVVATPIVEAGVNWDFDVAFRDATNTFSLVQVAGRVCRSRKRCDCEGEIYVAKHEGCNQNLLDFLDHAKRENVRIDWRIPFDYSDGARAYGYERVINLQSGLEGLEELDEDIYEVLFFAFMLPSRVVSSLESVMNYSLLREPLAHFLVGGKDDLAGGELSEIIDRTATYSLSLAKRLRERLLGFAAVGVSEDKASSGEAIEVAYYDGDPPIDENSYARVSSYLLKKLVERGANPLFACYLVDEGAYDSGVGFRVR
ncbi:MAG: CRISPR-associated helicase Cas3' [Thermofilaceae archaeon]